MTPYESAGRAYTAAAVMTASPEQLVSMLYDGAIRFLRQAASAARAGKRDVARRRLRSAHAIIQELSASLDLRQGEVAARLHTIYRFCTRHLNDSTAASNPDGYEEVADLLAELRSAWEQIAERPVRSTA